MLSKIIDLRQIIDILLIKANNTVVCAAGGTTRKHDE